MWFMWISISISSTLHCNILTPIDHASLISSHFRQIISFVSYSSSVSLFLLLLIPKWIFPPPNAYNRVLQIAEYSEILQIKSWIMKKKGGLYYLLDHINIQLMNCLYCLVCLFVFSRMFYWNGFNSSNGNL